MALSALEPKPRDQLSYYLKKKKISGRTEYHGACAKGAFENPEGGFNLDISCRN